MRHIVFIAAAFGAFVCPAAEESPMTFVMEAFIRQQALSAVCEIRSPRFAPKESEVRLTGTGAAGAFVDVRRQPDPDSGRALFRIDGQDVPKGKVTFTATVTHKPSGRTFSVEKTLDSPLAPTWLGTEVGLSDEVPAPWTDLEVEGAAVRPWGRTYRFERSILPTAVETAGAAVLAGPIVLRGMANGITLNWRGAITEVRSQKSNTVVLKGGAEAGPLSMTGTATVEFDGMIRVDLALHPNATKTTINHLTMEIPLKPAYARYLYHFPGRWGSVANSGYLPEKGWHHAFKPFVWLGDEERGFSWFCESDEHWTPVDRNRALVAERTDEAIVLRLNLIGWALDMDGPLTYTFGFQATPVKQPEKTTWDYRISHRGAYGIENSSARLAGRIVYPARKGMTQVQWFRHMGVRTLCFHEQWSPYQSYPYVTEENRERLRSLVDGCHAANVKLLLYMARSFSNIAPEWELYSKEMLLVPRRGGYHRKPEQRAYHVCWRSPWKDFCLQHLAKLLDEFGHDGWYLDGAEWPMPCRNRHHGCGYETADGTIKPTYDIFATREFMKRLYILTRRRKPEGQLNIHNSTVMTIPTLGWGTSTWGGEQLDTHKPGVRTLDILPLDAFRTEFMGRQWGAPAEFLVYENRPYTSKEMLAYTLLHGVLIRPNTDEALARISPLWKLYDRFPFRTADFYPYWDNKKLFRCEPEGIYATAYHRPQEGLLMFVSNLGEEDAEAAVTLTPSLLGWNSAAKAWNALREDDAAVQLDGNILRFPLKAWEYLAIRVVGEGKAE